MQAPRGGRAGLLSYNAFLSLDKSWSAAIGGGARRSAVVCFALQRVWTESYRKSDLSQRVI